MRLQGECSRLLKRSERQIRRLSSAKPLSRLLDPLALRRRKVLAANVLFVGPAVAFLKSVWTMRGALHKPLALGLLLLGWR
jgi:hypothetical protein